MPDHPIFLEQCQTARATGSHAEAFFSSDRTFSLMLATPGRLVTVASCRFDEPARTIERALRVLGR